MPFTRTEKLDLAVRLRVWAGNRHVPKAMATDLAHCVRCLEEQPPIETYNTHPVDGYCNLIFFFAWYDFWVGWRWDKKERMLYILPLPCIGVKMHLPRKK